MSQPSNTPFSDRSVPVAADGSATDEVLAGERPYTARSVLASTLLGVDPPELPARLLVRVGELFDISEGTARVAISRMAAAGELLTDEGTYRLGGHLLERQERQAVSRHALTQPWDGRTWRLEVVAADSARTVGERADLRAAMASLRLGEVREGVWLRPANLTSEHSVQPETVVRSQCRRLDATPSDDPARLAAELWDLSGWATQAETLRRALAELQAPLDRRDPLALPAGFVVSAAVLRHFQADPLLPTALLPPDWPGNTLRRAYELYDTSFKATWRQAFRAIP